MPPRERLPYLTNYLHIVESIKPIYSLDWCRACLQNELLISPITGEWTAVCSDCEWVRKAGYRLPTIRKAAMHHREVLGHSTEVKQEGVLYTRYEAESMLPPY